MKRLFFILLLSCLSGLVFAEPENTIDFLSLSDIHFNPFANCANQVPCPLITKLRQANPSAWKTIFLNANLPMARYHQDTNAPLLFNALQAAQNVGHDKQAKFVLVLGDNLGHDYRRLYKMYSGDKSYPGYLEFVRKTYSFLNEEIGRTFPSINVYMAVGNNDSYNGDYVTNLYGTFFSNNAQLWSRLIKSANNRNQMQSTFSEGGYYSVILPEPNDTRLIVLNSNLFSFKARGRNIKQNAQEELNWLHQQLMLARENKQKVFIAMHIPEGIDIFASLRIRGLAVIDFWQKNYTQEFQQELREFAPEIVAIFAGHLHTNWLQILRFNNLNEIPMIGTPSISPVYGNQPGFKLIVYSVTSNRVLDYLTYHYALAGDKMWSAALNTVPANSAVVPRLVRGNQQP